MKTNKIIFGFVSNRSLFIMTMKNKLFNFLLISLLFGIVTNTVAATKPFIINKALLQKLIPLKTSREIENLLGEPCCCVPFGKQSQETAICQWKPDTTNHSTINTLNITYEVDHVGEIRATTAQGTVLVVKNGKVKVES